MLADPHAPRPGRATILASNGKTPGGRKASDLISRVLPVASTQETRAADSGAAQRSHCAAVENAPGPRPPDEEPVAHTAPRSRKRVQKSVQVESSALNRIPKQLGNEVAAWCGRNPILTLGDLQRDARTVFKLAASLPSDHFGLHGTLRVIYGALDRMQAATKELLETSLEAE